MMGGEWVPLARGAALAIFVVCQVLLAIYGLHRFVLLHMRRRASQPAGAPPFSDLPRVTIQLPVYNEPRVVERLIDAACGLDYPTHLLEIQVLDDSTDETTALARRRAAQHRSLGVPIVVLHRDRRDGFKAGALRDGMRQARGEFFAIFDADFLPRPDFLQALLPAFRDPRVGMVQARWGHVNERFSVLTRLQALLLDGHFRIEQGGRSGRDRFFNFNGTAGIWRRACIEDAGGWSAETLTEDLDLSYRAQLAGWRFQYREDVVVPAELPADVLDFKTQQHRWAKGSLQTARKVLPAVWRLPFPLARKVEAFFHLTSNVCYLTFLLSALLLPVAVPAGVHAWSVGLAVLMPLSTLGVLCFFTETERLGGRKGWRSAGRAVAALALGMGMSLAQTRAVLGGLLRRGGAWQRTPKHGIVRRAEGSWSRAVRVRRAGGGEFALAAYFTAMALWFVTKAAWAPLPFLGLLIAGLLYVGWLSAARPVLRPALPPA